MELRCQNGSYIYLESITYTFSPEDELFQTCVQQITASHHRISLQHDTHHTLQTLKTFPSYCNQDLDSLILTKQKQLPREVFDCSLSSIVHELGETLADTAFFGVEAYVAVPALLKDLTNLRNCLDETTVEAKVSCALEFLPNTVQAVEVVVACLKNYVGKMEVVLPLIVEDIQQCKMSSESQFEAFLESTLEKAKVCAR